LKASSSARSSSPLGDGASSAASDSREALLDTGTGMSFGSSSENQPVMCTPLALTAAEGALLGQAGLQANADGEKVPVSCASWGKAMVRLFTSGAAMALRSQAATVATDAYRRLGSLPPTSPSVIGTSLTPGMQIGFGMAVSVSPAAILGLLAAYVARSASRIPSTASLQSDVPLLGIPVKKLRSLQRWSPGVLASQIDRAFKILERRAAERKGSKAKSSRQRTGP